MSECGSAMVSEREVRRERRPQRLARLLSRAPAKWAAHRGEEARGAERLRLKRLGEEPVEHFLLCGRGGRRSR
jgi:hypothetical protein